MQSRQPIHFDIVCLLASVMVTLALMLQALVPVGYMVKANAQGDGIAITLCTPQGSVAAIMAPDGQIVAAGDDHHTPGDQGPSDQSPCAFAAHTSAAQATFIPPIEAPQTFALTPSPPWHATAIAPGHGLAAPPPPKTGPPIQA